jgi:transposase
MRPPAKIRAWLTPAAMVEWVYAASAEPMLLRKRLAVWLTAAGPFYAARVAQLLSVAEVSVWRWVARYNRLGPEGLGPSRRGGRRHGHFGDRQQEAEALAELDPEALAGDLLSAAPIRAELERAIGRSLSHAGLYQLLTRHRWRKLVPRPRHPQTEPEALEAYKKTLPRLGGQPRRGCGARRAAAWCCSLKMRPALGASARVDAAAGHPTPNGLTRRVKSCASTSMPSRPSVP